VTDNEVAFFFILSKTAVQRRPEQDPVLIKQVMNAFVEHTHIDILPFSFCTLCILEIMGHGLEQAKYIFTRSPYDPRYKFDFPGMKSPAIGPFHSIIDPLLNCCAVIITTIQIIPQRVHQVKRIPEKIHIK